MAGRVWENALSERRRRESKGHSTQAGFAGLRSWQATRITAGLGEGFGRLWESAPSEPEG